VRSIRKVATVEEYGRLSLISLVTVPPGTTTIFSPQLTATLVMGVPVTVPVEVETAQPTLVGVVDTVTL
jgi:uncharacterized membrane protein